MRVRGNPDSPITIVEFGDFQCPYCGRVEPTLTSLLKKYKGKLAFRNGRFLEGSVPEAQFEKIIDSDLAALKGRKAAVATR